VHVSGLLLLCCGKVRALRAATAKLHAAMAVLHCTLVCMYCGVPHCRCTSLDFGRPQLHPTVRHWLASQYKTIVMYLTLPAVPRCTSLYRRCTASLRAVVMWSTQHGPCLHCWQLGTTPSTPSHCTSESHE
jgi:hypothetical protein